MPKKRRFRLKTNLRGWLGPPRVVKQESRLVGSSVLFGCHLRPELKTEGSDEKGGLAGLIGVECGSIPEPRSRGPQDRIQAVSSFADCRNAEYHLESEASRTYSNSFTHKTSLIQN